MNTNAFNITALGSVKTRRISLVFAGVLFLTYIFATLLSLDGMVRELFLWSGAVALTQANFSKSSIKGSAGIKIRYVTYMYTVGFLLSFFLSIEVINTLFVKELHPSLIATVILANIVMLLLHTFIRYRTRDEDSVDRDDLKQLRSVTHNLLFWWLVFSIITLLAIIMGLRIW